MRVDILDDALDLLLGQVNLWEKGCGILLVEPSLVGIARPLLRRSGTPPGIAYEVAIPPPGPRVAQLGVAEAADEDIIEITVLHDTDRPVDLLPVVRVARQLARQGAADELDFLSLIHI